MESEEAVRGKALQQETAVTFAFTYSFVCPICKETYNSDREFMLANDREQAVERVTQKHGTCPLCRQSLAGLELDITIFPGDAGR